MIKTLKYFSMLFLIILCNCHIEKKEYGSWESLIKETNQLGKTEWKQLLKHVSELHKKSTHPAAYPFDYPWEEIGPGYVYGRAFGHWDIIHQVIDVMPSYPAHALHQLINNVKNQEPSGLVPGTIWMPGGMSQRKEVGWLKKDAGHPPVWIIAVEDYINMTGNKKILKIFYTPLIRQITWFENERKAENEGFYYNDILIKKWESGVDQGIRFDKTDMGPWACIDATSHVYLLYKMCNKWSKELGFDNAYFKRRENELKQFIQNELYSSEEGMFYDIWAIKDETLKQIAFENIWPIIVGAATKEQADKYINKYLLNPDVFFTEHPIATVGVNDPKFELRMWRGPAWNSMTYWAVRGCLNYDREDAALKLLEKALDATAKQFEKTGTIWEFYHPLGGNPEELQRKPHTEYNTPCKEYLGHNPVIEMARLYDKLKQN
jgi:hypothetical protein